MMMKKRRRGEEKKLKEPKLHAFPILINLMSDRLMLDLTLDLMIENLRV